MDTKQEENEPLSGCIHLVIKQGKISNVFSHLENVPTDGVIHIDSQGNVEVMTSQQFLQSHPEDGKELEMDDYYTVFQLGGQRIDAVITYLAKGSPT